MVPAIEVRDARLGDAETLVALWRDMAVGAGHQSRLLTTPTVASARSSVVRHLTDPSCRLIVGSIDSVVGGMAFLRRAPISPLHHEFTITIEYLHVSDGARRHGLGKALIAEAAAWAEQEGSSHLAVLAPTTAREANRFLARLGLGQAGVLRFASTHTVRRRLAAEHAPNLLGLLSSRRSLLARRALLTRSAGGDYPEQPPLPTLLAPTGLPVARDLAAGGGGLAAAELSFPAAPESAGR